MGSTSSLRWNHSVLVYVCSVPLTRESRALTNGHTSWFWWSAFYIGSWYLFSICSWSGAITLNSLLVDQFVLQLRKFTDGRRYQFPDLIRRNKPLLMPFRSRGGCFWSWGVVQIFFVIPQGVILTTFSFLVEVDLSILLYFCSVMLSYARV